MGCLGDVRPRCSAADCTHDATGTCGRSGCAGGTGCGGRFCQRHLSVGGLGGIQLCSGCIERIAVSSVGRALLDVEG